METRSIMKAKEQTVLNFMVELNEKRKASEKTSSNNILPYKRPRVDSVPMPLPAKSDS